MTKVRKSGSQDRQVPLIDLERYVPGYLTWIANKLTRGASQAYLAAFDAGVETWRLLVLWRSKRRSRRSAAPR